MIFDQKVFYIFLQCAALFVFVFVHKVSSHASPDELQRGISVFPDVAALSLASAASSSSSSAASAPLHNVPSVGVGVETTSAVSRDAILQDILRAKNPNREIHVEDFLWTGSGDGDLDDYDFQIDGGQNRLDVQFVPTTLVVTSTVFVHHQKSVSVDDPSSSSVTPGFHLETGGQPGGGADHVRPTPVLPPGAYASTPPDLLPGQPGFGGLEGEDQIQSASLPNDEFLVRTIVLSNMTIIHNKIETFKKLMEDKLTRAFRTAMQKKSEARAIKRNSEDATDVNKKSNAPQEVNTSAASTEVRTEETEPIRPRSGRQIRSADEIEKIMKSVEKYAAEMASETTTTTRTTLSSTTLTSTTLTSDSNESQRSKRQQQQRQQDRPRTARVQIHNIRSSLPRPEIEMIYTVYQDDGEPMQATEAVHVLDGVGDNDIETLLGFPLLTKAEPYTAKAQALVEREAASQANLMIAVVIVSAFLIVVIALALLVIIYRAKNGDLSLKHKRFLGSPTNTDSRNASQAGQHDGSPTNTLDRTAFTLDRPLSKQSSCIRIASDVEDERKKKAKMATSDLSRSPSIGARATAGGESPTMADLSSNNTPDTSQRSKKMATRRQKSKKVEDQPKYRRELTPTGYSSGGDISQSAFPLHTPDKSGWLGPLTDLLEEEIILPGESRDNSASVARGAAEKPKNWAYLPPRSPTTSTTSSSDSYKDEGLKDSPPWRKEAQKTRRLASHYKKTLDETFPREGQDEEEGQDEGEGGEGVEGADSSLSPPDMKLRALSAKSHIFRKGKIEKKLASMGKNRRTRPWSAHESRISADPVFHMRQRHWEGLIAGKKHLHRGQLLPGSTSSEEDQSSSISGLPPPPTCWSECSSPRKQVRISEAPLRRRVRADQPNPVPLIQAIKDELQRFHRAPNLTGISIINDPDLLQKESAS